jgi:hypothetical protein
MFVKFDGSKIIAGPQSAPAGRDWILFIPAKDKKPRQKTTVRFDPEQNAVVQELGEEFEPAWPEKRSIEYGKITEQLDKLFHDIDNGTLDKTGQFYTFIKGVKDNNPKT